MIANRRMKPDTQMPAVARPLPASRPLLLRIWPSATRPKIPPSNAVIPHENNPRIPKTSEAMARPLISGACRLVDIGEREAGGGGGLEDGTGELPGCVANASANSG